jgi:transposase
VVSDADRRCLIEVLDGRDRRTAERWLSAARRRSRPDRGWSRTTPYGAYRQAIHAALPPAGIVCGYSHHVRGADAALGCGAPRAPARGPCPQAQGRAAQRPARRRRPELYRARHRLLKVRERLTERERPRLAELFERDPISAEAWGLKEDFRHVYRASDRADAERRLEAFLAAIDRAGLPALHAFAKGGRLRQIELLAYFDEPTLTATPMAVINKVKVVKRRAYGIPTFTAFRQRVLLACS